MTGAGRPRVHLTPPTGWMNDPCGLAIRAGRLHAFYQYEPDAPRWGRMRWGHSVTRDLVHWEPLAIAIEPDANGPDAAGCWSGCLVDADGTPTIFYTGVVLDRGVRHASICVATGDADLRAWTKLPESPVVAGSPAGIRPDRFRDPFVWRDQRGWSMIVGAGTDRGLGAVRIYRSDDLRQWHDRGTFLGTEDLVRSCPDLDVADIDSSCWECPHLVRFGDDAMLVVSVVDRSRVTRPAHVVAVTGQLDGDRFIARRAERLGLGPDFYAPSTVLAPDGRCLLFGWIPEDPPTRNAERDWAGALTLPRVLSIDAEGRPAVVLAAETETLGTPVASWNDVTISGDAPWTVTAEDGHAELRLRLSTAAAAPIRIDLLASGALIADIRFDPRSFRLSVSRLHRVRVAGRDPNGSTILPRTADEVLDLRLIVDGSILELVANDRVTATVRLPTLDGQLRMVCSAFGGSCRVLRAELRRL